MTIYNKAAAIRVAENFNSQLEQQHGQGTEIIGAAMGVIVTPGVAEAVPVSPDAPVDQQIAAIY